MVKKTFYTKDGKETRDLTKEEIDNYKDFDSDARKQYFKDKLVLENDYNKRLELIEDFLNLR